MDRAAAVKQCLRTPSFKSIIAHVSLQTPKEANVIFDKGWFTQYIGKYCYSQFGQTEYVSLFGI